MSSSFSRAPLILDFQVIFLNITKVSYSLKWIFIELFHNVFLYSHKILLYQILLQVFLHIQLNFLLTIRINRN
jgi:hypothetical protein